MGEDNKANKIIVSGTTIGITLLSSLGGLALVTRALRSIGLKLSLELKGYDPTDKKH